MHFSGSRIFSTFLPILEVLVLVAFSAARTGSETMPPGIRVELIPEKPLCVRVTVRSGADRTATFLRHKLPWGNRNSILFVAVTPEGIPLEVSMPVDDPIFDKFSLAPGASVSGDIDLNNFFGRLRLATKKSDIHLFWAYESPEELHIPHWSGGWVLLPQQK
jgi:hypothetical protein